MTMLRVHDIQQSMVIQFVKMAKTTLQQSGGQRNMQQVYLKGQEMGFCNDEINVLLEDVNH